MLKNYTTYSFEDFINDDDFIQWVKHPTDRSNAFWAIFIQSNPSKASTIQQAREAIHLLGLASKKEVSPNEGVEIWSNIEAKLRPIFAFRIYRDRWVAAASILLALGLGYWFLAPPQWHKNVPFSASVSEKMPLSKWIYNKGKVNMLVILPDSSTVLLKPQSQLKFNESFVGNQRQVYLQGEAFFKIKKDPKKPFFVLTSEVTTRVIGTSFLVKAYEHAKEVTVDVTSGKVFVFRTNEPVKTEGVLLTPNQKAVFEKEEAKLIKTIVDKPLVLTEAKELTKAVFKDAPISRILQALEKRYGIIILYDEESMANCRLTTTLTDEEFIPMLDIICEGIEATYKVVDGQVVITSNGCL